MRSHRGGWLRSWVLGAILVVAPAVSTTVRAQPGFGPDPFWPYNNQYTPYTTAVGPASPLAGQGNAMIGRQGYNTANQFQQYLDGMAAPGRTMSDRSGVGVPYFRGSVNGGYASRDYEPNAGSNRRFEEKQQEVTKKYFAYFSEKDPKKRAELLRDYQRARRESARELSPRSQSPSRVLQEASRTRPGSETSRASRTTRDDASASVDLPREPGTISRSATPATRSDTAGSARVPGRPLRPAPPMPSVPSSRVGGRSRSGAPSSVLNRARNMGDGAGRTPGSTSGTPRGRRPGQTASPLPPATSE